ncbi:MAG: class 1 fructose-bisphosphatase, partial [Deinococcus sp.]|nr:class 1 fructose-bisphosphatase [Deinococcus sp.]
LQEGQRHPDMAGELSALLVQIGFAAKILSWEIGRAALVGKLGLVGEQNPTGDAQKKLDVFANETVIDAFAQTELVAGLVSEELDDVKLLACSNEAKYILCTDPLDGSSNTDINGAVGTIFGFYRRRTTGQCLVAEELRRKGAEQVAAGYVMYGTSTVLVYTCGHGVHGFTLDRDLGEFLLSHEQIRCPVRGHTYSANLGRSPDWHPHIRRFIEYLTIPDPATHRPYSLRYTGALVADLHRILLEGGLYLYPADAQHSDGKLRLLYECAPLALVVEQAGGRASTGTQRMLDLQATSLHQRAPLVIGSAEDVALYERLLTGGSPS